MIIIIVEIIFFFLLGFITVDNKRSTNNTFLSFDITRSLRGIAILMIIIMHSCAKMHNASGFSSLGGIGVSIFLILSAYGLTESYKKNKLKSFWKKKLFRLCVPYFIFLLFVTLIIHREYSQFVKPSFYLDLFCIKTSYWFISFLVYNYILFWTYYKIKWNFSFLIFVLFGLCIFIFDNRIRAEQVLSFPFGIILSEKRDLFSKIIKGNKIIVICCTLLFMALLMFTIIKLLMVENPLLLNLLLQYKFIVAITVLLLFNKFPLHYSKFLDWCAENSLELYLVHFTFYTTIPDGDKPWSSMFVFLVISFAGAWIFNLINKKIISYVK